ncbi:MAG: signal peptidase I [Ruminococcaceae bacterium]|nr:signal peptidase I [Oscillospiraceae bacterium]
MKQSQTKDKSIGNLWLSRIVTLILGVAVCFCLFVLVQVVSRGYASLGGYSFFKVVTGSMEPNLSVGELLLTKQIDPAEIAVDDIISFRSRSPGMIGAFITHRVIGKDVDEGGTVRLWTKGDANLVADVDPVTTDNLVGKVVWKSGGSFVSKIMSFLSGRYGFLVCIAFPMLLGAAWILRENIRAMRRDMQTILESIEQSNPEAESSAPAAGEMSESASEETPDAASTETSMEDEEYQQLCEKIRAELIEELKHSDEPKQPEQE